MIATDLNHAAPHEQWRQWPLRRACIQYAWDARREGRRHDAPDRELDDEQYAALLEWDAGFDRHPDDGELDDEQCAALIEAGRAALREAQAREQSKPNQLAPDLDAIRAHIYELCNPAFTHAYPNAVLEIAYGHPAKDDGDVNRAQTYLALNDKDLQVAAEIAAKRNAEGFNTYAGAALRQYGNRAIPPDRRATVENYLASRFAWVDFDKAGDAERVGAVLKDKGLVPFLVVTTGTIPHRRGQLYFLVSGVRDAAHLREVNSALQRLLGSDPAVINAQQVLRLAGSINYPTSKKLARGYVAELTTLKKIADAPTYSADHLISLAGPTSEVPRGTEQRQHYDRRSAESDYFGAFDDLRFEADPELIASALEFVPNKDLDWLEWKRIVMAAWRATNGSPVAFEAIDKWSRKSSKYDARNTEREWKKLVKSPPTDIGAGTIFKIARDNGWKRSDAGRSEAPSSDQADAGDGEAAASPTPSAAAQELAEACEALTAAKEGQRSELLHKLAFAMGQLIGAARMQEQQVVSRLTEAARDLGMNEAEAAATITSGIAAGKSKPRLPTIKMIPGQIAQAIDFAEAELLASGFSILQRGGVLVQPVKNELAAADDTKTEVVVLRALRKEPMVYLLNKHAAVFKRYNERKKQFTAIDPPSEVALGLIQKDQWDFPDVSGVTTTPTMPP
jgi:hypothetical protein